MHMSGLVHFELQCHESACESDLLVKKGQANTALPRITATNFAKRDFSCWELLANSWAAGQA